MAKSKRQNERRPLFQVVRYNIDGREYADLSTNISSQGIFLKNTEPPPNGSEVVLTLHLPPAWGNLPLRIVGLVVHTNNDPDLHKRGMGIRFLSISAESPPIIEYFVRQIFGAQTLEATPTPSAPPGQYQVEVQKKP
jgi:hypothetical protein